VRHPTVEKSYDLGHDGIDLCSLFYENGPFMRLNTLQLRLAISVGGVWTIRIEIRKYPAKTK